MKKLVNPGFREEVKKELPGIADLSCGCPKTAHWEMLRTAMFSSYVDKETDAVRFGAEEIARAYGTVVSGNLKAGQKLQHFMGLLPEGTATQILIDGKEYCKTQWEAVDGVVEKVDENGMVTHHRRYVKKGDGVQRRVRFNWSEKIQSLIDDELNSKTPSSDKVYFVTGFKKNEKTERNLLRETIESATNEIELLECQVAKDFANYLNKAPINSFTQIVENGAKAIEIINTFPENVKKTQLRILASVLESPKPIYAPSCKGRTDRLFGVGANITNLKSEVRQILTEWDEVDIKACHLAVNGYLWDIQEVKDFLKTGKSFWKEILDWMGLPMSTKYLLKDEVYAVFYGMPEVGTKNRINEKFPGLIRAGERFLSHPLIAAILKARKRIFKEVKRIGSVQDAFGISHSVDSKDKDSVKSIVSRVSQSYEMLLLKPIFDLAETTDEFSITLLQHDGCSLKFHKADRKEFWMGKIDEAFNSGAAELNIDTRLEWKMVDKVVAKSAQVCEPKEDETTRIDTEQNSELETAWNLFNTKCELLQRLCRPECEPWKKIGKASLPAQSWQTFEPLSAEFI